MSANSIVVDGVTYVKAPDKGARAVVVVDRGWIFAGDVTEDFSIHVTLPGELSFAPDE